MKLRTIQSELLKNGLTYEKTHDKKTVKKDISIKRNEKLSNDELRMLMGEFKPKFSRGRGGAFRQR